MNEDIVSVSPDASVYEALELLSQHEISGLPVVGPDQQLVGILTEKDVLKLLLDHKMQGNEKVETYMNRKVFSFTEDDSIIDVCKFFIKNPIRRVPIVRDKKVVGIVARRDIINLILEVRRNLGNFRHS